MYPGGFDGLLPPPAGYRGGYTERAFPSPGPGSAGSAGQGGSLLHAAQQAGNEGASVAMPGASLAAANGTPYPPSFLEVGAQELIGSAAGAFGGAAPGSACMVMVRPTAAAQSACVHAL